MTYLTNIEKIQSWLNRTIVSGQCLLWQGALRDGYAIVFLNGKSQNLHRVIYQNVYGEVPKEIRDDRAVLDHLCQNRNCINFKHLELITNRENIVRGSIGSKTHCKLGHIIDSINKTTSGRYCSICSRYCKKLWQRKYEEKKRAIYS